MRVLRGTSSRRTSSRYCLFITPSVSKLSEVACSAAVVLQWVTFQSAGEGSGELDPGEGYSLLHSQAMSGDGVTATLERKGYYVLDTFLLGIFYYFIVNKALRGVNIYSYPSSG